MAEDSASRMADGCYVVRLYSTSEEALLFEDFSPYLRLQYNHLSNDARSIHDAVVGVARCAVVNLLVVVCSGRLT